MMHLETTVESSSSSNEDNVVVVAPQEWRHRCRGFPKKPLAVVLLFSLLLMTPVLRQETATTTKIKAKTTTIHNSNGGHNGDVLEDGPRSEELSASFHRIAIPDPSEWIDDIDATDNATVTCGRFKCLFESRTNGDRRKDKSDGQRDGGRRYGYLVAPAADLLPDHDYGTVLGGWMKALELSKKYPIRHLLLSPPEVLNSTRDNVASKFEGQNEFGHNGEKSGDKRAKIIRETQMVIVQPVELAPPNSYLYGCSKAKTKIASKKLQELELAKKNNSSGAARPQQRFEKERLRSDLSETMRVLRSDEGACLMLDFQVIIDPIGGLIYHLDFDRCFEFPNSTTSGTFWMDHCGKRFRKHVQLLLHNNKEN